MPTGNLSTTDTAITSRPNTGPNTEQAATTARQGSLDHRRVSTQSGGSVASVRESADDTTVATPASARTVSLADALALKSLDWFAARLPKDEGSSRLRRDRFELAHGGELRVEDMKNVVDFARAIDKDIVRAAKLLSKSDKKPLNAKSQQEVNTLLRAGKYNLEQVQRWASAVRGGCQGQPSEQEFMAKLQERLADRHMALANIMCRFDIDQAPSEQAVSRADRIDYNLVTADAALKVVGGLSVKNLSENTKQKLVDILDDHRAELGQAKDIATGRSSGSDKSQVVSKEVWRTSFNLTKGKNEDTIVSLLHKHWDAEARGATGRWLPLAYPGLTQERMLQEFVGYQLKKAGVAKKDRSDLRFQFKEAANQVRNERPWEPIAKQLNYAVDGISHRVQSTITPAGAMADRFAEPYPAKGNGICCSDRMQYTHVPNLARTELTDASGAILFSALRHGVLDAYDISVATLRKLPKQELATMLKDLYSHSADSKIAALISKTDSKTAARSSKTDSKIAARSSKTDSKIAARSSKTDSKIAARSSRADSKIAYLGKIGNTCPEQCAVFAADHFNLECKFETYKDAAANKEQIDITAPVGAALQNRTVSEAAETDAVEGSFTDGRTEESCLNYLLKLDKDAIYHMRTGRNDGGGHNQMLYSKNNEWFAYDDPKRQLQLTSNGTLTRGGAERMVNPDDNWGVGLDQVSIFTLPVTEQGAKNMIRFIKDFRNEDEPTAMLNLFNAPSADQARVDGANASLEARVAAENPYDSIDFPDSDGNDDTARELDMQRQMEQRIAAENPYDSIDFPDSDGGLSQTAAEVNPAVGGVDQTAAKITPAVGVSREDTDYGIYSRIDKTRKDPEDEAEAAFNKESTDQTPGVTRLDGDDPTVDSISTSSPDEEVPPPLPPRQYLDQELFGQTTVTDIDSDKAAAQVATVDAIQGETFDIDKIQELIRTKKSAADEIASAMRTAASAKMAKELAVAALVSDPDKLQAALDGEVVDLNLSSISLLTPDRVRPFYRGPKSNEREMLRRQTEALQSLSGEQKNLQVRDASGDLRTVVVNCKVRTFNFGVNEGAVSKPLHIIPQDMPGWGKLMGWSYAMERNNPELKTLLGDRKSDRLGGEVLDKLNTFQKKYMRLKSALAALERASQDDSIAALREAAIPRFERECAAIEQRLTALRYAAEGAKTIWREGSYNKGGQDPYKMVSRLGVVINAMGETLAFNCKSGKDRTGQLDAELKYLSALALNDDGQEVYSKEIPRPGELATPELRQMRSDFTLGTGNLEMQRLNTGLPGFKLKGVPGLANYIAGPEMKEMYLGGSNYVKG